MGFSLFKRKLKDGRISLYINCSLNGYRKKEALGIFLETSRDKAIKEANKKKLKIAKCIVLERELSLLRNKYQKELNTDCIVNESSIENDKIVSSNINLFDIFGVYINEYEGNDVRQYWAVYSQLKNFNKSLFLYPNQITNCFCTGFRNFLKDKYKGNTPFIYFKKFRSLLDYCLQKGMISENPASKIYVSQSTAITKEILTIEEIKKLASASCRVKDIKRAFLFSCYSGLRWSDIVRLKFSDIDYNSNLLIVTQKKVLRTSSKAVLRLALNSTALHLLGPSINGKSKKVFDLPSHTYTLKIINEWVKNAGLSKHITFHCARHTFVTLLISSGADIKTVSSLAGHTSTRQTETYIHVMDSTCRKAVDAMPQISEINL